MITGGDLRQSRLDVGYKTFTISPCKSEAAPAFDLGKTIVVLAERPKNGPSVNPLRTVFD